MPCARAQGRARRGAHSTRRRRGWSAKTAMNRGQVLYRVAELMGKGAARSSSKRLPRPRDCLRPTPRPRSTGRLIVGSGTPAGPTRSARLLGTVNPVSAPYFNFSIPSRPVSWASSRPSHRRCWDSSRALRRLVVGGNAAVVIASESRPAAGGDAGRGARHVGRSGGRPSTF